MLGLRAEENISKRHLAERGADPFAPEVSFARPRNIPTEHVLLAYSIRILAFSHVIADLGRAVQSSRSGTHAPHQSTINPAAITRACVNPYNMRASGLELNLYHVKSKE